MNPDTLPRVGISACLLGEKVRYDGDHSHDPLILDTLGTLVQWIPVCPETECGLPVPRPAMRLCGDSREPKLLAAETGLDHTKRLIDWARLRIAEMGKESLAGFVFKSRSPSCGLSQVKVYDDWGEFDRVGTGLFARALLESHPDLPVEDDQGLRDSDRLAKFIAAVVGG